MQMPAFEHARSKFLARRSSSSSQDAAGIEGLVLSGSLNSHSLDLAAAARLARLTLSGEEFTPAFSHTAPVRSTSWATELNALRDTITTTRQRASRETVHNVRAPRSPSSSDSGSISSAHSETAPDGFASDATADDGSASGAVSNVAPVSITESLRADEAVQVPLLDTLREEWSLSSRDSVRRAEQQLPGARFAGHMHSVLSCDKIITQVRLSITVK
jgi:hypothetical protein